MDEFISHTSWIRDIPDDTPVVMLSIPETHNIVMDYFEEPRELVSSVIKKNFTAGAASGPDGGHRSRDRRAG